MSAHLEKLLSGLSTGCFSLSHGACHLPQTDNNAVAEQFWAALAPRSTSFSAPSQPRGPTSSLPSLTRSTSFTLASPQLDRPGPEGQPQNPASRSGESGTKTLQHSRTLPTLNPASPQRQAPHGSASPTGPTRRRPMPRSASMFVLPGGSNGSNPTSTNGSNQGSMQADPTGEALCQDLANLGLHPQPLPASSSTAAGDSTGRRRSYTGGCDPCFSYPAAPPASPGHGLILVDEVDSDEASGSLPVPLAVAPCRWQSLEDFKALRMIASNKHSTVWEASPKAAGDPCSVVIKVIKCSMDQLSTSGRARLQLEQRILQTVVHENIIKGLGSFEENGHMFLVMEHADGRNLQQFISYRRKRNQEDFEGGSDTTVVPEADAACLALAPLLDALAFLHAQGIIHRDIKPANAVFTRGANGCLKLIDYGLCLDRSAATQSTNGPCFQVGTPEYWAPELLGDHAPALNLLDRVDCWAVGVLAFQLLTGTLPWSHEVRACLLQMLVEAEVPFGVLELVGASPAATDFVRQALTPDPCKRPSAAALRAHPWLLQHAGGQPLEGHQYAA